MSIQREFRISDQRSEINVFLGKARKPVITLNFNPADPFIAEYIDNIRQGLEGLESDREKKYIDELGFAAAFGKLLADNFDAICGEGAARNIGKLDSSGNYQLFFDILDEIKAGLDAHYTEMSEKTKAENFQAVIDAKKEGSSYIAPQ